MSELQTALLAIGFGVVVAIYTFGWWQQRQYSRKYGEAFKANHSDALYHEERAQLVPETAPVVQAESGEIEHVVASAVEVDEVFVHAPILAHEEMTEPPALIELSQHGGMDESCSLLDVRSDFIIELNLIEPAPAAILHRLWQRKFDFGKPLQVCGLTSNTLHWERAIAESSTLYARFKIALQLVDRGGAMSEAKLTDFRELVLGIAKQIKAEISVPNIDVTHAEALELDKFCASVDQMVGVNLVPPGERFLQGTRLAQAAALVGMTLESDGAFHVLNTQGNSLFALMNQDTKPFQHHTLESITTPGVTLLLDVPRVENPALEFDRMARVAQELAKELQVNVVDDNRVLLNEAGLALIRAQIVEVETKMLVNGIAPGSAQARRLFS